MSTFMSPSETKNNTLQGGKIEGFPQKLLLPVENQSVWTS